MMEPFAVQRFRVPILMYHKIGPVAHSPFWVTTAAFQAQMLTLRRGGYTALTLLESWECATGSRKPPLKPVVITFDDGYEDLLTQVLPILSRRDVDFKATAFIATGLLGSNNEWDEDCQPLANHLNWAGVRELHASGYFDVQSHAVSHRRLTSIGDGRDLEGELTQSRRELECNIGKQVRFIAWPYGDSNASIHASAAKAGYMGGVDGRGGIEDESANRWMLRRLHVDSRTDVDVFRRRSLRDRLPPGLRESKVYGAMRQFKRKLVGPPPIPKDMPLPAGRPGFHQTGDSPSVWIETPVPTHHLSNALYHAGYATLLDQRAQSEGCHFTPDGPKLTVLRGQRAIYFRDATSGAYFSLPWLPVGRAVRRFRCEAEPGAMHFENETDGLTIRWSIDLPCEGEPVERWRLAIRNVTRRCRPLDVFIHSPLECLDDSMPHSNQTRSGAYHPQLGAAVVRTRFEHLNVIADMRACGFLTADRLPDSWDLAPEAFIGAPDRTLANPLAVERGICGGSVGSPWSTCAVLHFHLKIPAGEAVSLTLLTGASSGLEQIAELRRLLLLNDCSQQPLSAGKTWIRKLHIVTGEPLVDQTVNHWATHQCHFGMTCGAWGTLGYRDMLQWASGCLAFEPDAARRRIEEAVAHQYADGTAPRAWRPLSERRPVDGPLWLTFAADACLREFGELDWLEKKLPFIDRDSATIYEHLRRGLLAVFEARGRHGLCLMGDGDWNDALDGLGPGAESVWVSMAFCRAAAQLEEIAAMLGRSEDAAILNEQREAMMETIEANAWDGNWYLRAFTDAGAPVGGAQCSEGRLYINTQSWAVLGGLKQVARRRRALDSVRKLLGTSWGYRLLWPPYSGTEEFHGRISMLPAGCGENGSIYTHANGFMVGALLQEGMADEAFEVWSRIHPRNANRPIECMPTIFHHNYQPPGSNLPAGLAGHAWVTGSVAWMLTAIHEGFCGLRAEVEGLYLMPLLPGDWKEVRVVRTFRGTDYDVRICNPTGLGGRAVETLTVNGTAVDPLSSLPGGGGRVTVEAVLGGAPRVAISGRQLEIPKPLEGLAAG